MKKHYLALAFVSMFATTAQAQVYVSGAVGASDFDIDCAGTVSCDTEDTGYKIFGGYKFNPYFALEVGYIDFGETKASVDLGFREDIRMGVEGSGFTVGLAGFLPLGQNFTGVARAGLFNGKTEASASFMGESESMDETNVKPYFGLGLSYNVTKQFAIDLSADFTKIEFEGISESVRLISLGATYSF